MENVPAPEARSTLTGHDEAERLLRARLDRGALSHGWIVAGPKGLGKATLAYRLARALLDPSALTGAAGLSVEPDSRVFRLVAGRAHPDLFIAQREWDEKKSRYESEISVEKIRNLTNFLNVTASYGGWRVAIVDAADDMNRNAANALLKALEEPPADTLIILVAHAPGRLLATIQSRCRRLVLRPVAEATITRFLEEEGAADGEDARMIAAAARGLPGRAIRLAEHDGVDAVACAESFFIAATGDGDFAGVAAALTGAANDAKWELFSEIVLESLSDAARSRARGEEAKAPLADASVDRLLDAWEKLTTLSARGDALNLDRGQLVFAMGRDLRASLQGRAA